MPCPLVTAVVPVHNRRDLTLRFIRHWQALTYARRQLIIVDDGSNDGTADAVDSVAPEVLVLREDGNAWWSGATNTGVRRALADGTDLVLTINDDAVFPPDFLENLILAHLAHPKAMIGCRIMRQDDPSKVWASGVSAPFTLRRIFVLLDHDLHWGNIPTKGAVRPCDTLCGNGTLIPVRVFRSIGFFDQYRLPQYHGDGDFALRHRRSGGVNLVALDAAIANHITSALPRSKWDTLFSKRSPLYLPALVTLLWRHAPLWKSPFILIAHLLPPLFLGPRRK